MTVKTTTRNKRRLINLSTNMQPEVHLLQLTKTDWNTYIKVCTEHLGESPTRGIDQVKIMTDMHPAFISTLDLNNHPEDAIKDIKNYKHTFLSFLVVTKYSGLCLDACGVDVKRELVSEDNKTVLIVSGTLWNFFIMFILYMGYMSEEANIITNKMYIIIERLGYGKVFEKYETVPKPSGIFILKSR